MTRLNKKDLNNRNRYLKNELKIWLLKSLITNTSTNPLLKVKSSYLINRKLKLSSKSKIINWCVITSRSKSVLKAFGLSWMKFKELASKGQLPGIRKRNY